MISCFEKVIYQIKELPEQAKKEGARIASDGSFIDFLDYCVKNECFTKAQSTTLYEGIVMWDFDSDYWECDREKLTELYDAVGLPEEKFVEALYERLDEIENELNAEYEDGETCPAAQLECEYERIEEQVADIESSVESPKWIQIWYSWGDQEPAIEIPAGENPWEYAKKLAVNEAETAFQGFEERGETGLMIYRDKMKIDLHYNDGEWCFYCVTDERDFEPESYKPEHMKGE